MALIFGRKPDESFVLKDERYGTEIVVTIGRNTKGGNVEVIVDAPPHVRIRRSELSPKDMPPPGALNNPQLPTAEWRDRGRKFAKRSK